ncbi:MAG TPA: Imm63 family immunity protein [Herpetosiphonaceae bacterium]
MKTPSQIEAEVKTLAQRIGASRNDLPTYGHTRDGGYPHIEVDATQYHYIIVERGRELERRSTSDFAELLYWIFSGATHSLAFAYELKHRSEAQDCRRIAFAKQIELLEAISPAMATRRAHEIEAILNRAPYHDRP